MKLTLSHGRADFLLVLPCFHESKRLPSFLEPLIKTLCSAPFTTKILIVDDGSSAIEQRRLANLVPVGNYHSLEVLPPEFLSEKTGKGGAILHGWRSQNPSEWRAFVDADGATSAEEVYRVLLQIHQEVRKKEAYFAIRLEKQSERSAYRSLSGKLFRGLVHMVLGAELSDSQCGFKVVSTSAFSEIESQLQGYGFCFDLELYMALKGRNHVPEEMVVSWKDKSGGHIHPLVHSPRMILNLIKIRNNSQAHFAPTPSVAHRTVSV